MRSPADILWRGGDLTERVLESERVFEGRLLDVRRDVVQLPDGSRAGREYVRHPGAVAVVALNDAGDLVLERQFRYPLARDFYEIPAGKIDPGESPLATARRELIEETGYVASDWRHLATIHPLIAYSDEAIEIFLARGIERREARLDAGEFLEVFTLPFAEALEWVRAGHITDAKTVSALFWADRVLDGCWEASAPASA